MNKIHLSILAIIAASLFGCTSNNKQTEIKVHLSEIDYVYSLSDNTRDSVFMDAFYAAQNNYTGSNEEFVTLLGQSVAAMYPEYMLSSAFSTFELKDRITFQSTNEEVINVLKDEIKLAFESTIQVLKRRIELTQPSNLFNKLKILVKELPEKNTYSITINRIVDENTVSELLEKQGNFGFWETHELSSVWEYLDAADKATKEPGHQNDSINLSKSLFSFLLPSVSEDGSILKGCLIGYTNINDTATVNHYLNLPNVQATLPRDFMAMWSMKPESNSGFMQLFAIKNTRDGKAPLSGDWVVSANVKMTNGMPTISLKMNAEGANIWGRMTNENIDKQIAIVVDNTIYAAPFIYSEIKDGNTAFTGNFTEAEAANLAAILSAGQIPNITVKVLE